MNRYPYIYFITHIQPLIMFITFYEINEIVKSPQETEQIIETQIKRKVLFQFCKSQPSLYKILPPSTLTSFKDQLTTTLNLPNEAINTTPKQPFKLQSQNQQNPDHVLSLLKLL